MIVGGNDILVVNTDNRIDEYVLQRLKDDGYNLHQVAVEADSLSHIRHTNPDLVLISDSNPENGLLGFIKEIRAIRLQLPIVLLLNADELSSVVPCMEQGATDFALFGAEDLLLHVIKRNLRYAGVDRRVNREALVADNMEEKLNLLIHDQQAGFRVQSNLMPYAPSCIGGVRFDHKIFPSLIMSGDFIDYFPIPDNRILFYLADVSGHGASSGFVTVLLRSLSRRLEEQFVELGLTSTGEILSWMSDELLRCDLEHHVTMFLGVIDATESELEYSNAAHFPASILSGQTSTDYLEIGGRPLGLFRDARYETHRVKLPKTYTLVMFSDGVFEIMPQETLRDKEEYLLSLVKCGTRSVGALADHLNMVQAKKDDIAVLTVAGAG
ncbi:MAG: fused response regulator/phosphatase [Pseudomonadales bacterium]|nr:fused response regulator/phosphatase [Pseudomonadales bacterium]